MNPPLSLCSICEHPHRDAIDAKLLAKREDGSNAFSGNAVAAWMATEGITPAALPRTLNRHRKVHLRVSEQVAKRLVSDVRAKLAAESPEPKEISAALEAALIAEGANVAALDEWALDLARYRKRLLADALGKAAEQKKARQLEPHEVSFLVNGGRSLAALAVARDQILTGGKGRRTALGEVPQQLGLKDLVSTLKQPPAPIDGDRPDDLAPPTREEIEAALADMDEDLAPAQSLVPDPDEEDDPIEERPRQVIDMPAPPDSGEGVTAPTPYVYRPPPLRLVGGG